MALERLKRWTHDKLDWGYPEGQPIERDSFQNVFQCRFCRCRLAKDSQGNWFHLTKARRK